MKNPFTSNENIFEKIGRRDPARRQAMLTRGVSAREKTPTQPEKTQFAAFKSTEMGAHPIQNITGHPPNELRSCDAHLRPEESNTGHTVSQNWQLRERFAIHSYTNYDDAQQQFSTEERKPILKVTRACSSKEQIKLQEAPVRSVGISADQKLSKQQGVSIKKSSNQYNRTISQEILSDEKDDVMLDTDPPQLSKPNPFLRPHVFQASRPEQREARRSEQSKISSAVNRDKSLTNPDKHDPNRATVVVNKLSFTGCSGAEAFRNVCQQENECALKFEQQKYMHPNPPDLGSPRTVSSQDTLQQLNKLFDKPHLKVKTYGSADVQSPSNPLYVQPSPMNLNFCPLNTQAEQRIDPALFEDYVKICMMNSSGREELRRLVGMDIPEPLNQQVKSPKVISSANEPFNPSIIPSTNQHNRYSRPETSTEVILPTFNVLPPMKTAEQLIQPGVNLNLMAEAIHDTSSVLVRDQSLSNTDHFRDVTNRDQSHSTFIELDESVPKVRPYQPPVLTEKSDLKIATSQLSQIHRSEFNEPDRPATEPQEIRLKVGGSINQRVQEKLKKHYQGSSTRVFLSFGEKLTMKHYPLKD